MSYSLFIHSAAAGHVACFQLVDIMYNAAVDIPARGFWWTQAFVSTIISCTNNYNSLFISVLMSQLLYFPPLICSLHSCQGDLK